MQTVRSLQFVWCIAAGPQRVQYYEQRIGGEERSVDPVPTRSSRDDKNEGAMDRAKGRVKEAGGALTGDKGKKREGRADQRKGKAKEKKGNLKDLLS